MNKKETILKYFSEMNIKMLDVLLNDDYTYQDISKHNFLEKIEELFKVYKKRGDKKLTICKGKCNSKECTNYGKDGYAFIGDKSNAHINFIFEESDNDFEDIYQCYDFKTEESIINSGEELNLKITHHQSVEYQDNLKKFRPFIDLNTLKVNEYISIEKIEWWLLKYSEFYKAHKKYYTRFSLEEMIKLIDDPNDPFIKVEYDFLSLYEKLDELTISHKDDPKFKVAIENYNKSKGDIVLMRKWVAHNKKKAINNNNGFIENFKDYNSSEVAVHFRFSQYNNFQFKIENSYFRNTIEFINIYNRATFYLNYIPESLDKFNLEF